MAYIPGIREPLRITGLSRHWEPTRIPTPRFIDAWSANEKDGPSDRVVPVLLDVHCENVVVLRAANISDIEMRDMYLKQGQICFCRVYAKSGLGRQDAANIGDAVSDSDVDDSM